MNKLDIIRAWKDELFRKSLSSAQQTLLPEHPAGEIVLSEAEMATINGGIVFTDNPRGCKSTETTIIQMPAL